MKFLSKRKEILKDISFGLLVGILSSIAFFGFIYLVTYTGMYFGLIDYTGARLTKWF
jgi:hypothetical protein